MNVLLGKDVEIVGSRDQGLIGIRGTVVLESMHMVTLDSRNNRKVKFAKLGSAMRTLDGGKTVILGDEIEGRLEDRIAGGARI